MAIGTRGARGRIASTTACGRRHCRLCRRWRPCLDFGVAQWADKAKTRPRYLKSECDTCHARVERRRRPRPECRAHKKAYDARRYELLKREREREMVADDEGWVQLPSGAWVEEDFLGVLERQELEVAKPSRATTAYLQHREQLALAA